jgi:uncharacterized protein (TIGR02996 family)
VDELTFLAQLTEQPSDDTRLVYADWLDEQGQAEKAEFLRLEHQVRAAKARLEVLAPALDPSWLGAVYGYHELELLGYPEGRKIETIKLIRELTGKGLADSKRLSESLPSIVFEGSGAPLLEAKARFEAFGAAVRMTGSAHGVPWLIHLFGRGRLELVSYPSDRKIPVIMAIRELTQLGLKEAKDMSESLPAVVLEGDEARLSGAKASLEGAGASVRLLLSSLPTR